MVSLFLPIIIAPGFSSLLSPLSSLLSPLLYPLPFSVQVFVDEIDAIAPKRADSKGMERRIVAQVRATHSYAYEE